MENNTRDLAQFGFRELAEAGRLLTAYTEVGAWWLYDGVTIEFNPNSGIVFLVDDDNNVGMLRGDTLEQWFSCLECGAEGFREDLISEEGDNDCNGFLHAPDVEEEAS